MIVAPKSKLAQVYTALGNVLNNPAAFGLGNRAPEPLVEALTLARKKLMQEMIEQKQWQQDNILEAELSQDADRDSSSAKK